MIKIWFLVIAGVCLATATDYCRIKSCGETPHTMCLYKKNGPNRKSCTNPIITSANLNLKPYEQAQIVKLHNQLRAKVARGEETRGLFNVSQPAGRIGNLRWNHELAKIAQRWANQCEYAHDQCRNTDKEYVGQNIAKQSAYSLKGITMAKFVNSWYNEVEKFDTKYIKKFDMDVKTLKKVGHYTQLVWGNTKEIGCGLMKNFNEADKLIYGTLVCNYGPAGNVDGQPIYQTL